MGESEKIHPIRMRNGGIEYFVEKACPDCGTPVFFARYGDGDELFADLDMFAPHRCPVPESQAPPGYPFDLGKISPETALQFRSLVENAFGKPLRRFSGALKKPGLPIHFVSDWKPFLGHVRVFSKTDVHRPLDPLCPLFARAIPILAEHFGKMSGTRHRKYYLSARGIYKAERSRNLMVIRWKWPARY